jgi:hypothetical protein
LSDYIDEENVMEALEPETHSVMREDDKQEINKGLDNGSFSFGRKT